mgnify:CR=1 FL=1
MSEIYDIYHDESKQEAYWHGFLFVPRNSKDDLLELLLEARSNTDYHHRIHYSEIKNATKSYHEKAIITKSWTTIGVYSLQQQKLLKLPPLVFLGVSKRLGVKPVYRKMNKLVKAKFVLLKDNDNHKKMFSGMSELECIETTFRMGLKGGVHKLFSEAEPITIGNVFIDGDEQYTGKFGRTFDINRSLRRFAMERKPFVSFCSDSKLIPQKSDHQQIDSSQDKSDSHLLQLCDILIGGFRFYSYCPDSKHIKYKISYPCRDLLNHDQNNYARMKESRFFNGFSLSQAQLVNDQWEFNPLNIGNDRRIPKIIQKELI